MAGLVTLQQGPLGVAASTRRPVAKPAAASRTRVSESPDIEMGGTPASIPQQSQSQSNNFEEFQPVAHPVSSATLLEASLLSGAIDPEEGILSATLSARLNEWEPPISSLTLRDRRV